MDTLKLNLATGVKGLTPIECKEVNVIGKDKQGSKVNNTYTFAIIKDSAVFIVMMVQYECIINSRIFSTLESAKKVFDKTLSLYNTN